MTRFAVVFLMAVVAVPARADLKIEQSQPNNKSLIILAAAGSDAAGAGLIWDVTPTVGVESAEAGGQLFFTGPAGVYTVKLRAVLWDKKQIVTAVGQFVIGAKPPLPIPDPPPVTPPTALYFAVVRVEGPASPAFTKVMSDLAWDALRKAGHAIRDFTPSELAALQVPFRPDTPLPAIITIRNGETSSTILRGPIPLPTTSAEILKLPEGVK